MWIGGGVAGVAILVAGILVLRPPAVEAARPVRGPAVEAVYATGIVKPLRYAQIGSKTMGRVAEVAVAEGDRIEAGALLAQIDNKEDEALVAQAAARLVLAEADRSRALKLRRAGNISAAALDQAESALGAARAALAAAQARLDDHAIRAPISGVVLRSEQQLKVGDLVQIGQVLFLVGDPSALQIEAEVDEEDIPKVKAGQEALIRADAFPGQTLKGSVAAITPYGDPVARTYRIHIALPADTPLISGMTSEINIVVSRRDDALLVPVTALSGGTVWTVENGRAKRVAVEIGTVGREMAEIRSGLAPEAVVVGNPPAGLQDGDRLRVVPGA